MGLPRKNKTGSKGKSGKKTEGKAKEPKKPQPQLDANKEAQLQLLPQERVLNVKPSWAQTSNETRVDLLSISLEELRLKAIDLADKAQKQAAIEAQEAAELDDGTTLTVHLEPGLDEVFEEGTRRLLEKSTWKLWQWPPEEREFFDADSFRQYAEEHHIDAELRKLLPRDEGKPVEKPAERALRERMAELLQKVHATNRQLQETQMQTQQTRRVGRRDRGSSSEQIQDQGLRDSNIELITIILEALEKEHEYLYNAVLYPVTHFVCEMLPEQMRESTRTELFFDDLEKLPSMEVARICEWLTEKVDGFSSKTRAEPKEAEEEEEEEGIGDVDLFTLSDDRTKLSVNVKWLQHLQERLLGEDGHPRKVHEGEDPNRMGLVLEWVYGTIVSTAEKARDGAKRPLGMQPPTVDQAHEQLIGALQDMQQWETRAKQGKDLLNDMLKSRREAAELATKFDIRPDPRGTSALPRNALLAIDGQDDGKDIYELPDHVIIALLRREHLLTKAKLNALCFEHIMGERRLRSLKTQLRQGEPEFDRLKRELEEVKNQPRGLEGTFRTAAEMERHRAQLADAAIEEQLEVQTAFREHGARLQGIYDKRQRTEHEMVHREQEIKQLQGWAQTVLNLVNKFEDALQELGPLAALDDGNARSPSPDEEAPAGEEEGANRALARHAGNLTQHRQALAKLRQHFQKDVRRQLYADEDDRKFFGWVQTQLKSTEKRLEDGRAVLHHLEAQLINVACDDPGAIIGAQLALPLLQERLDAKSQEYARQQAAQAEQDIIKMEEDKLEKERAERERKLKQKQKAKDRVRTEKEKLAAEKEAAEKEARERSEEQHRLREEQSLAARETAAAKKEELKKAEELLMEARRQELLNEEDGYWRQRMDQQQLVEKLKAEVAEQQEELKGQSEDGTEDSSASTSTPVDDASETSPVKPQKAPHEPDSPATVIPNANGFRHTNGVDSDGFRRPHDRRPNALPNGRLPHAEGHASQDGFGVPGRGRSQGRTEPIPRGRSSDVKHDSFTGRPANTLQQGDHADRYGPRRYGSKDADRPREVARPRREVPQKDGTKPLSVFRNPDTSRNTVMASKGADGRIAITAEAANATKPASANHVTPQQDAPVPKPQPSVKAAAETPLPRPAPVAVATAPTASATHPITPSASSAGPNRPTSAASDSASVPSISREHFPALPEIAPPTPKATAAPAAVSATASDSSVPAASSQMGNPPPGLSNPEPSPAPPPGLTNQQPAPGPVLPPGPALHQPQSQPQHQQPSVVPHGPQPARSAQHSGVSQPQMPSPAQAPAVATTSNQTASLAPQHQAQPAAQIPNGFPHSQLHQQMLHRLHQAGVNNRLHLQNQPADSHPPFAQPRPIMAAAPQQNGNMPMTNGPPHVSPPTEQRASPPADTDMGTSDEHAAPQQAPARPLHQGSSPQSSRSGSVGHKRPMPAQEYQQPHPSQQLMPSNQQMLGPQHQARGGSAGPPVMGSPFNGAQLTSGMLPQYMHPNHNGMPSNGPMPTMRLPNGMQNGMVPAMFSPNMIPPNQRPSLNMNHMMAMLPKPQQQQQQQQQGSMPYPAPSQYVMQQQMGSGPMPQLVSGAMHRPNTSHSFPINNPQAQPFHPRDMPQQPNFNQPRPSQPAATPSARPGPHAMPTLSTSKSLTSRALRADAPSFVPGGFAPQSPAPQAPQTPSAALLHQAMQGRAAQADQQPSLAGPAAGQNTGLPGSVSVQEQPSASGPMQPLRPLSARLAAADPFQPAGHHMSADATPSSSQQDTAAQGGLENMNRHQPPHASASLQVNPSAAIMSGYPPPAQPDPPQAQSSSFGRASLSHASTATGINMPAAQTDTADSSMGRQAAQAQASSSGSLQSLQGDSPKTRWSAVAANQEQPSGRPRGFSPQEHGDPSASGQGRAGELLDASISGRSAQEGYSRTDSGGSIKDSTAASRDRRASGAAAGTSASIPQSSSASSLSGKHRQSGQRRRIVKKHGLVYEDRQEGMRRLKLVRGLSNMSGQYNCFLNVIIQSLWHLPAFRQALLTLPISLPDSNGASPKDAAVVRALHNVFAAFAKHPSAEEQAAVHRASEAQSASSSSEAHQQQQPEEAQYARADSDARDVARQSVSPDELREALSELEKGQSPIEFELSEMHDAAEVLGEVFNCLHRAQLGSAAARSPDPGLPQIVRVPKPGSSSSLTGMVTPTDPSSPQQGANSMVQDIFGQKVQVPSPADDVDSPVSKRARAEIGQWQQQQSRASASQQRQQAQQQQQQQAAAKRLGKDANLQDMQQFWKYFHLVPAQALRVASDSLSKQGSFEAVLREADSAEALLKRRDQAGTSPLLDITLLSQPRVFTLAIVWESAKVAEEAITSTVDALSDSVNLSHLFKGVSASSNARYVLKSIICYFGHHYQVYALSEELEQWLLFDDTDIQLIGDWQDVKARIRHSRLQPSVLFYERLG